MNSHHQLIYSKRLQTMPEENLYFLHMYLVMNTNIIYKRANIFKASDIRKAL